MSKLNRSWRAAAMALAKEAMGDVSVVAVGATQTVAVGIADDGTDGDRKLGRVEDERAVPTIALDLLTSDEKHAWPPMSTRLLHLTWDEARALADALIEVTDVAEHG